MGTPTAPRCPAGKYRAGPRRKAGPSRRRAIARGRQWLGEIVYGLGSQRLATGQAPDASDQFDTLPRLSLSPTGQCSGRESTASRLQHRTPATPGLRLASPPVRISGIGGQSRHYSRHGLESLPRPFCRAARPNPRWEQDFAGRRQAPESEPRDQNCLQ